MNLDPSLPVPPPVTLLMIGVVAVASRWRGFKAGFLATAICTAALVATADWKPGSRVVQIVGVAVTGSAVSFAVSWPLGRRPTDAADAGEAQSDRRTRQRVHPDELETDYALHRTEDYFHQLAGVMPQVIWSALPDGRLCYCNRWYRSAVEPTEPEARPDALLPTIHPDDRARYVEAWAKAYVSSSMVAVEYRMRAAPADAWRPYQGQFVPLRDDGGRIVRWFHVAADLSDRRRVEELVHRITALSAELRAHKAAKPAPEGPSAAAPEEPRARVTLEAHDQIRQYVSALDTGLRALQESLQADADAREKVAELRGLSERQLQAGHLLSAQEAERRRIARELHDQLGQYVTAFDVGLRLLHDLVPADPAALAKVAELRQLAGYLDREVHHVAVNLRPPALDELGLRGAVQAYVEQWAGWAGVAAEFRPGGGDERLPAEVETAVYRVIQEALTNVSRHAFAAAVSVVLRRDGAHVLAVVEDDGRGFDLATVPPGKLGLVGMRERIELVGGVLTIESAPGCGTALIARVPLRPAETSNERHSVPADARGPEDLPETSRPGP